VIKKYVLRIIQILFILLFGVVNFYNFAVIHYTIERDGKSLRSAETFLSELCHRMPSRSLWISEIPMGLCSRCTGIYFALFVSMLYLFFKVNFLAKKYLLFALIATLPLIIDGTLQYLGFYLSTNFIRTFTGLLFGSSIGFVLMFFTTPNKPKEGT